MQCINYLSKNFQVEIKPDLIIRCHRFHNNLFFRNLTCFHGNIWHFLFSLHSMVKIGKLLSEAFLEDLPKKVLKHERIAIMFATSYQTIGYFYWKVLCWVVIKLTGMVIRKLQTVWKNSNNFFLTPHRYGSSCRCPEIFQS